MSSSPIYYARFRKAGWHRIADWGEFIAVKTACGRTIIIGDDTAEEVTSTETKVPRDIACVECGIQLEMDLTE